MRKLVFIFLLVSIGLSFKAQVNYVGNPSLETLISCSTPNYLSRASHWNSIDSSFFPCGGNYYNTCFGNVPKSGPGLFQYPRTGNAFVRVTFLTGGGRTYPKNRLVSNLVSGNTYCVKMYLNLQNSSPNSIDAFGVYFGDATIDTISQCWGPLTYLTPQIQSTPLNFITDTLGWTAVEGSFVANGTEKYLIIGNFKTYAATTMSPTAIMPPSNWSEYNVDDVSVIDFNLAASAGPDKNIFLGDSAFIGRPPEIGLECTWSSGTVSVGSGGGLWVKPTSPGTYSYVVTQNICGNIKTDTVNVNVSPSSINENTLFSNSIILYPQPAKDIVNISLNYFYEKSIEVRVVDVNGRTVGSFQMAVSSGKAELNTTEFSNGVYILELKSTSGQVARKRLVVVR